MNLKSLLLGAASGQHVLKRIVDRPAALGGVAPGLLKLNGKRQPLTRLFVGGHTDIGECGHDRVGVGVAVGVGVGVGVGVAGTQAKPDNTIFPSAPLDASKSVQLPCVVTFA